MQSRFTCPQCNAKIIQTNKGKTSSCKHFNQNIVKVEQTTKRTKASLNLNYVFNNLTGTIVKI